MIQVNPPPQPELPEEFAKNKATRLYFKTLTRFFLQLWKRTGAGEDFIDANEQSITSTNSKVNRNAAKINSLEKTTFDIVFTTVSTTVSAFETLICNNPAPINVLLDTTAIENDVLNVKRNNAQVTVLGTIDGQVDMILNVPQYSTKLVFNGTDWSRI